MPFVPVVRFWQTRETIPMATLRRALRGGDVDWARVLIPTGDRAALETALDLVIPDSVREAQPGAIIDAVQKGNTLGILRASDVRPSVRALGIDGRELFGNDRVSGIGRWPLVARVEVSARDAWRQADTWTLVAGGDSFTDRGIYERVEVRDKGVDYPFDGGTARVTGHHICPSCPRAEGNLVPIYRLSGPKGVVRALVRDADLAIANHEQPTPTNWVYHLQGLVFSGKPELTRIFTRAGIDFLSLANNHIRDYGDAGVINTLRTLDRYGIRHAGAGRNVRAAARPAYLEVNGVTVGIVSCNQFSVARVRATRSRAGALTCKSDEAFDAIREARTRADVLIVFPHWGREYTRTRQAYQERLAARWERMGVDVVIGAHSHVPGGIGDIDGMPVFYSLGNFIFDQSWSTATMEGILAEMTFAGDRLVQIRIHPFLTHDQAQPNLLDPARDDGKALMDEIRKASRKISDW
jgi:poly-gamma-glutamate synthesis protein (capsule biosynthesis protein)